MVSFWPWGATDNSPASFERTLSALARKIADTQGRLDLVSDRSRRRRVLLTLYLSFAYLVYGIVLLLVVGWKKMGAWEWTGISGGPVVIYVGRTVLATFYSYRIGGLEARLRDYQGERARTIQKLKDATRYESTQELLDKYSGEPKRGRQHRTGDDEDGQDVAGREAARPEQQNRAGGRTTLPPPPTANIVRSGSQDPAQRGLGQQLQFLGGPVSGRPVSQSGSQSGSGLGPGPGPGTGPGPGPGSYLGESASDYAPDAFPQPPRRRPSSHYDNSPGGTRWYDRILDVLMGEDERWPKNRIVLVCKGCRLVNGQAPPGVRSLGELGMWRCLDCGMRNGEMDEGKRLVREVLEAGRNGKETEGKSAEGQSAEGQSAEERADVEIDHVGADGKE